MGPSNPATDPRTTLAELRATLAATPFYGSIGIDVERAESGLVAASMGLGDDHLNVQGLVHGGIVATLADAAMGLAVRTAVGPERSHVTIEMGVHFLLPARSGRLTATGRVLRAGARIAYAEADVTDDRERLVARANGSYAVGERVAPAGDAPAAGA